MMLKGESSQIKDYVMVYLQDVYDHVIQIIDTLETYRDLLSGIMDIYMSGVNNKMNEIMKVLTIIATLFIPLTFLAGVYGMNFKYFPELELEFAYPVFWMAVLVIFLLMLAWFKHKRWF
jgi:magnesium transporter